MMAAKDLLGLTFPDTNPDMNAPEVICAGKTLAVRFAAEQAVLSWSLTRPGFTRAQAVAWLQVSDADLPVDVDPVVLLRDRLADAGFGDAVQFMTSRDVKKHHQARHSIGDVTAFCLATVGLANAGRVGEGSVHSGTAGTINLVAHVDQPLDEAGMVEALSIAVQARTAAIMDLGWTVNGTIVTGTGTDCVALACPAAGVPARYAGLHTDIGAAIGGAVYRAVQSGGMEWVAEKTAGSHGAGKTQ